MKTEISTPDELYVTAVAELLAKHTPSEVTAHLDRVYETEPSTVGAGLRRAQHLSLEADTWQPRP